MFFALCMCACVCMVFCSSDNHYMTVMVTMNILRTYYNPIEYNFKNAATAAAAAAIIVIVYFFIHPFIH